MRLTLRTLLAYLDDILDETDAQELEKKIDESEMATKLAQRIRQIVGQTRLDTPALEAEGLDGDANAVAEYLDNTLSLDDVPEFERLCLNSDVHLGEVAACHQILTLILGEPAATTAELRERIHQIGQSTAEVSSTATIEETATIEDSSSSLPVDEETAEGPSPSEQAEKPAYDSDEHWTSAPDYLKRPRRTLWKPVGLAALIVFCLIFAGLFGMGPLDQTHPLASLFLVNSEPADSSATVNEPVGGNEEAANVPTQPNNNEGISTEAANDEQDEELAGVNTSAETVTDVPTNEPDMLTNPDAVTVVEESPSEPTTSPTEEEDTDLPFILEPEIPQEPASEPVEAGAATAGNLSAGQPAPNVETLNPTPVETDDLIDSQPAPATPTATANADATPEDIPSGDVPPEPRDIDIINLTPSTNENVEDATGDDAVDENNSVASNEVGKFLSDDELLARYNQVTSMWDRIDVRDSIRNDDRLLVFPVFRPQLMLTTGMQLTVIGPAQIRPQPIGEDKSPTIRVDFGRATVETFAQTGSTINIQWSDQQAVVTLADMDSRFAVEVSRQFLPGIDGESGEAHEVVHVYTMSGSVEWQTGDGSATTLVAGQRLTMVDALPARVTTMERFPGWIDGSDARPRDPEAAKMLLQRVSLDRPISLSLQEQAESQRLELRSLAVCSLAFLNEFDPLLNALNDNRLRSYWTEEYEALRRAMVTSEDAARALRQAMEERHGPEGIDLYRLMWGFDDQELAADGAEKLVSYLDHPSSDFRIVAHENLKSITGRTSLYMPHYVTKTRKRHIFKWKDQLNKGEIVYREPPELSRLLDDLETSPPSP